MNKTTIGIAMGAAALGLALGYYLQPNPTVATSCDPIVLAPAPAREVVEPAKDEVQQVLPTVSPVPAKLTASNVSAHLGTVLRTNGNNCAWIHFVDIGQWKAESLIHFGQSRTFASYEQAVQQTREGWCR